MERLTGEHDFWSQIEMFWDRAAVAHQIHEEVVKLHQEMEPLREDARRLVGTSKQLTADFLEALKK